MKYLVNRKTKEHCVYPEGYEYNCIQFAEVQADPEGWIKHDGTKCPLPDDAEVDVRIGIAGEEVKNRRARRWQWSNEATVPITHYRPILDDKVDNDEAKYAGMSQSEAYQNQCRRLGFDDKVHKPDYDPRSVSFNIIDRLKAAHQAASEIPDLVAELRQALEPMGLGVMYLSQFDEVTK